MKKESSKISRSTSSTCSFSIPADDTHLVSITQVFPVKQGLFYFTIVSVTSCVSVLLRSLWRKNPKASSPSAAAPQVSLLPPHGFSFFRPLHSDLNYTLFFFLELKNKNSPRSNLKFRFDKLSHWAAVSLSTITWKDIKLILWIVIIRKSFLNHDTFTGNND